MKQVLSLLAIVLLLNFKGQSQTNVFPSSGNVGIGTTTPQTMLDIGSTIIHDAPVNNAGIQVKVSTASSSNIQRAGLFYAEKASTATGNGITSLETFCLTSNPTGNIQRSTGVAGNCVQTGSGSVGDIRSVMGAGRITSSGSVANWSCFWGGLGASGTATGVITNGFGLFISPFPSNVVNRFGVFVNDSTAKNFFAGSIGVGTTEPGSFRLAVEGKIGTREVHVTNAAPFPDYVFKPEYKLRSLRNLETYIDQNGHLPQIPSAEKIKTSGYDVSKMDAALLKKVEELTLYVIHLNKRVDSLSNENRRLIELVNN